MEINVKEVAPDIEDITHTIVRQVKANRVGNPMLYIGKELKWIEAKPGDTLLVYRSKGRLIIQKIPKRS